MPLELRQLAKFRRVAGLLVGRINDLNDGPRRSSPQLVNLDGTEERLENTGSETVYVNDHRTGQFLGGRQVLAVDDGCNHGFSPGEPVEVGCFTDYRPLTLEPGVGSSFTVTLWRALAGMSEVTSDRFDFRRSITYGTTPFSGPDQSASVGELVLTYDGLLRGPAPRPSVETPITGPGPVVAPMPLGDEPSQSTAEAARDRVHPEVAALSDRRRSERLVSLGGYEGYWTPSRAALQELPTEGDGVLGDSSGRYGTDWVQVAEYGEIRMLGRDGRIERAYPMPGMVPSWIHLTDDAVYAGRIGDGALPSSSIVKIDRITSFSTVVVFPQGDLGPLLDLGWQPAPTGASIEDYATAGTRPDSTLVASSIGDVRIDLAAVQRLFE